MASDAVMLVMPADHVIEDRVAFVEAVRDAANLARSGRLVTFGIRPIRPGDRVRLHRNRRRARS